MAGAAAGVEDRPDVGFEGQRRARRRGARRRLVVIRRRLVVIRRRRLGSGRLGGRGGGRGRGLIARGGRLGGRRRSLGGLAQRLAVVAILQVLLVQVRLLDRTATRGEQ